MPRAPAPYGANVVTRQGVPQQGSLGSSPPPVVGEVAAGAPPAPPVDPDFEPAYAYEEDALFEPGDDVNQVDFFGLGSAEL